MFALPPDPLLTTARQLAADGAWRDLVVLLGPRAEDGSARSEESLLYAEALMRSGDERQARAYLEAVEPSLAADGPRALHRRLVNMIGVASFALGDLERANASLSLALELATRDDDLLMMAQATNNLGAIANLQGRHEDALWQYRLALPMLQRLGQARLLAEGHHNMAITFRDVGALAEADEQEQRAIGYAQDAGALRVAAMGRTGRAEIALRRGDASFAESTARLAVEELAALADPLNEADALRVLAVALAGQRRDEEALAVFARALAIARAHGHVLNEAETLRDRAEVLWRRAARDDGLADARAAMSLFERLGATAELDALRARIDALG